MASLCDFFTDFDFRKFFSAFLILFAVVDVPGSTAIIISMRKKIGYIDARKTATVAGIIMVTFLFTGQALLDLFSVDVNFFTLAGSVILFLVGLEMSLNISIAKIEADAESSSVVPLAFPMIVGTGTLATLITLKATCKAINVLCGTLANLLLIYLVLKYSEWIEKKLGRLGISIIHRMMGIILLAIAIKLFTIHAAVLYRKYYFL
ncbi:MAG: MarC family protein [Bacteroidota bacterium]